MGTQYYRLIQNDLPEANGNVLKHTGDGLEIIAGESTLGELNLSLSDDGKIIYSKDHTLIEISEAEAKRLEKDYLNWKRQQLWISTDATLDSIIGNIPGVHKI